MVVFLCTCVGVIICKLIIQENANMATTFVAEVQSCAICHPPAYSDKFSLVYYSLEE